TPWLGTFDDPDHTECGSALLHLSPGARAAGPPADSPPSSRCAPPADAAPAQGRGGPHPFFPGHRRTPRSDHVPADAALWLPCGRSREPPLVGHRLEP